VPPEPIDPAQQSVASYLATHGLEAGAAPRRLAEECGRACADVGLDPATLRRTWA
jgi:hypothetical protein